LILLGRGQLVAHSIAVWVPSALYYLYIAADLTLIKPGRLAKWARNSMPIWLILAWHYPLTRALAVPSGQWNMLLLAVTLVAFFPFFYEDYYRLQRFVRGLVVVYYFSLALLLGWPHPLGLLVAVFSFIAVFSVLQRTVFYKAIVPAMILLIASVVYLTADRGAELLIIGGLGLASNAYIQTFATVAYDIRKAGTVTDRQASAVRSPSG
jgi:hypothetical protein